jgi:hypothetical protein
LTAVKALPDCERVLLRDTLLGAWLYASKAAFSGTSPRVWAQLPLMSGGVPIVAGLLHCYLQQPDKYGPADQNLFYLAGMTQEVQLLVEGAVFMAWATSDVTVLLQQRLQQHYSSYLPTEQARAAAAGLQGMMEAKQHPLLQEDADLPGSPRLLVRTLQASRGQDVFTNNTTHQLQHGGHCLGATVALQAW